MMKLVTILSTFGMMLFASTQFIYAQTAIVKGKVINQTNEPIPDANIKVLNQQPPIISKTDQSGNYRIILPAGKTYRIQFSNVAYQTAVLEIQVVDGRTYDKPVKMLDRQEEDVTIFGEKDPTSISDDAMLVSPIKLEDVMEMPNIAPSVEAFTKYMPGVSTTSEFSSQYAVRGGNYDENLVYVNGIQIYRPFLTRSGQQEGLGFSNASMAQGLKFSNGGFGAQYGDKMSSVLDITYRKPTEFRASAEIGIISTNLHAEGITRNKKQPEKPGKFTWIMGARRFAMGYFLNSLETSGEYTPSFLDYQAMFTYTPKDVNREPKYKISSDGDTTDIIYYPNKKLVFTSFFSVTRNRYLLEPFARETTFGNIQQAFRLRVAFEGRELSSYTTGLGAFMAEYRPTTRLYFNAIATGFQTQESERFDIEGGYLLGEVNTNFGSSEFNETEFDLGIGTQFRHARNYLQARVASAEVNGRWVSDNKVRHRLLFGAKVQRQLIEDDLKEYTALDSAGYLVDSTGQFGIEEYIRGQVSLNSNLYKAYLQHEWALSPTLSLNTGARVAYYDLIDDWMFSPRVQLLYRAKEDVDGETKLRMRLAAGMYQQPPFYREFRRLDGTVNLDIKPQSSLHAIGGLEYRFFAWGRPFHLITEAYYKRLSNLIPYEVENVRIRYYPDRVANGYAAGFDARLNGEFIKGVDSWVSIGVLKTEEDVLGDDIGYVPRPTDQRFTFAMYFQDELPINPTYKVHVSYVYGSGMRFGPPQDFDLRTFYGFPAYHRADIGFSKLITLQSKSERGQKKGVESIWITLEIYNLLQRENTISYVWIKDLQNRSFAIPNRLSARLLNVRAIFKFR